MTRQIRTWVNKDGTVRRREYDYDMAAYQRDWRARNPDYDRAYSRALRDQVNAEKLRRGKCADCPLEVTPYNLAVFDFDHLDRLDKLGTISAMRRREVGPGVLAAEMAKCDLVCSNCHRGRTTRGQHWRPAGRVGREDGQMMLFGDGS